MSAWSRVLAGRPLLWFPDKAVEPVVRLTAGGVVVGLLIAYLTGFAWLVPLLAVGFFLRSVAGPRLSALAQLSIVLVRLFRLSPRRIGGAPKQIAAAVGATMLLASSIALYLGDSTVGWLLAGLVAVFAALEATLGFCVVCQIYSRVVPCPDCEGKDGTACGIDGGGNSRWPVTTPEHGGCAAPIAANRSERDRGQYVLHEVRGRGGKMTTRVRALERRYPTSLTRA